MGRDHFPAQPRKARPGLALAPDQTLTGPAIVESDTTTVLLRPRDTATFDGRGWLDVAVG